MSKIEFVSFGGQDEKDKFCSALIVDGDIYVLGCGIFCPSAVTLGIKKVIADFSYLIDNKDKIRGIFIPVATYNSFGGLEFLVKLLPNVPVFTSSLGQMIINNNLDLCTYGRNRFEHQRNSLRSKWNVNAVKPLAPFRLGNVEVMAFRTASLMPTSLGFVFKTDVGSIIFVDHFMIPTSPHNALNDLLYEINRFTKGNNLLLITCIGPNINFRGFASPSYSVTNFFENTVLDMPNRGIFVIEEQDVYKLVKLATIAAKRTIPFYVYSGSLARAFNYMQNNKIINLPNLIYMNDSQINECERGIVVVSGDKQSLFTKLQKIVVGDDRKLVFKPTDTFVYSILTTPGFEKLEANLFDSINRLNVSNVIKMPKDIIPLSQGQEDHKFILNILKPKYIIPVSGLYMDFVKYRDMLKPPFNKSTVILQNGQFALFESGNLISIKKFIKVSEQYVGSSGLYDVGANGLFECEQMSQNGCVLASLLVDKNEKKIIHYNYNIVGIINQADEKNKVIYDEINATLNQIMLELLKSHPGNLTRDDQDYFKKQILKQYDKKFGKRPLVLLTILYKDSIDKAIDDIASEEGEE